jgi:1,4-alpha-glucan branching enzyme
VAVHVERGSEETALVRFSLPESASDNPSAVSVVGSFNDWTAGAHRFNQDLNQDFEDDWTVVIEVPYGDEIHFRYLGENGQWFDDPDADVSGDDGGRITAVVEGDD